MLKNLIAKTTMRVINSELLGSWPTLSKVPVFDLPEIALIGRSNVGKSTLINSLVNRKSLARVSATPGKTQEAVLFKIEVERDDGKRDFLILVDLPGFGYAKVGKDKRQSFHSLIVDYISKRKELKAVCLLNDCRREPGEDEQMIWQAMSGRDLKCGLVITKCDKLSKKQQLDAQRQIEKFYPGASAVIRSGTQVGKVEIQGAIFGMLGQ